MNEQELLVILNPFGLKYVQISAVEWFAELTTERVHPVLVPYIKNTDRTLTAALKKLYDNLDYVGLSA